MSRLALLLAEHRRRTGTVRPIPFVRPTPRTTCPRCNGEGTRPGKAVLLCRCQRGDAA